MTARKGKLLGRVWYGVAESWGIWSRRRHVFCAFTLVPYRVKLDVVATGSAVKSMDWVGVTRPRLMDSCSEQMWLAVKQE